MLMVNSVNKFHSWRGTAAPQAGMTDDFIMHVKPVWALNTLIITGIFKCQQIMDCNQIIISSNIKFVFFSWYFCASGVFGEHTLAKDWFYI